MSIEISVPFHVSDLFDTVTSEYSFNVISRKNKQKIQILFCLSSHGNSYIRFISEDTNISVGLTDSTLSYDTVGLFVIKNKQGSVSITISFDTITLNQIVINKFESFYIPNGNIQAELNSLLWLALKNKSKNVMGYKASGLGWFIVNDILFFKTMFTGAEYLINGQNNKIYPIVLFLTYDILNPKEINKSMVGDTAILTIPITSFVEKSKLTIKITPKSFNIKFVEGVDTINHNLFSFALREMIKDPLRYS